MATDNAVTVMVTPILYHIDGNWQRCDNDGITNTVSHWWQLTMLWQWWRYQYYITLMTTDNAVIMTKSPILYHFDDNWQRCDSDSDTNTVLQWRQLTTLWQWWWHQYCITLKPTDNIVTVMESRIQYHIDGNWQRCDSDGDTNTVSHWWQLTTLWQWRNHQYYSISVVCGQKPDENQITRNHF